LAPVFEEAGIVACEQSIRAFVESATPGLAKVIVLLFFGVVLFYFSSAHVFSFFL
jgi:hypothetical protein